MKVAVMAVGRFQPPTIGHHEMIRLVKERAEAEKGDAFVFPTEKQGGERYPLDIEFKVGLLSKMFPKGVRIEPVKDAFQAAASLEAAGYTRIIWYAGSDRAKQYEGILRRMKGVTGAVVPLERDPDSDDLKTAISATAMRNYAIKGNMNSFRKGLNVTLRNNAPNIMEKVQKGMRGGSRRSRRGRRSHSRRSR